MIILPIGRFIAGSMFLIWGAILAIKGLSGEVAWNLTLPGGFQSEVINAGPGMILLIIGLVLVLASKMKKYESDGERKVVTFSQREIEDKKEDHVHRRERTPSQFQATISMVDQKLILTPDPALGFEYEGEIALRLFRPQAILTNVRRVEGQNDLFQLSDYVWATLNLTTLHRGVYYIEDDRIRLDLRPPERRFVQDMGRPRVGFAKFEGRSCIEVKSRAFPSEQLDFRVYLVRVRTAIEGYGPFPSRQRYDYKEPVEPSCK